LFRMRVVLPTCTWVVAHVSVVSVLMYAFVVFPFTSVVLMVVVFFMLFVGYWLKW